jgi:hypothetical protein
LARSAIARAARERGHEESDDSPGSRRERTHPRSRCRRRCAAVGHAVRHSSIGRRKVKPWKRMSASDRTLRFSARLLQGRLDAVRAAVTVVASEPLDGAEPAERRTEAPMLLRACDRASTRRR